MRPDENADVLDPLAAAARRCAQILADQRSAVGAHRTAVAQLLEGIAAAVEPAIEAITERRASVQYGRGFRSGVQLVEVGRLRDDARVYLALVDKVAAYVKSDSEGHAYEVIESGELAAQVDLPEIVRRLAERMRASITGKSTRRTQEAQGTAEKLFALEVLLRG